MVPVFACNEVTRLFEGDEVTIPGSNMTLRLQSIGQYSRGGSPLQKSVEVVLVQPPPEEEAAEITPELVDPMAPVDTTA